MANKSISQLDPGIAVSATDLFPDVQVVGTGPVKVTADQIKTFTSNSPTLVTPVIGTATGTSLSLGGAAIVPSSEKIKLAIVDGIIKVYNGDETSDSRIQFNQKNGSNFPVAWFGLPSFAKSTLYIYGPTASSTEIAASYTSGAWSFFNSGTLSAYLSSSGSLTIGGTSGNNVGIRCAFATQNSASSGIASEGLITTNSTAYYNFFQSVAITQPNVVFNNLKHYLAYQGTFGAGTSITNQYGFFVDGTLTGASNNFGFVSNLAASGTKNWNFYAGSNAPNYFAGNVGIGTTIFGESDNKVLAMANTIALSGSVPNVGRIFVAGGALQYISPNGTVTVIAPA